MGGDTAAIVISLLALLLSFCTFRILRKPRHDPRNNLCCGDGLQVADIDRVHARPNITEAE